MISLDKCVSVCVKIIEKCKGFWNENIFKNGLVSVLGNTRLFYKEKSNGILKGFFHITF